LQWKDAGEKKWAENAVWQRTTHIVRYSLVFVDEGWARQFAGVASTTIAYKIRIWTLEDLTPSTTTALDWIKAFYLIRKSTQEEVGSEFWKKKGLPTSGASMALHRYPPRESYSFMNRSSDPVFKME
jgi:hypothetical protein